MRVFTNSWGLTLSIFLTIVFSVSLPFSFDSSYFISVSNLSQIIVFLIFLAQGWCIQTFSLEEMGFDLKGLFRVHGLIFLGPMFFVLIAIYFKIIPVHLADGFFILCILPTTVSSCVVYTSLSGGNSETALGHATLSSIFGIFWAPLAWMIFKAGGQHDELFKLIIETGFLLLPKLFFLVLIPCVFGWLIKKIVKIRGLAKVDGILKQATFGGILILVYFSFSKTVLVLGIFGIFELMKDSVLIILFFTLWHSALSWLVTHLFQKEPRLRVAEFFCASQKSLAVGLPLAVLLSPNNSAMITFPMIFYHLIQLSIGAFFVNRIKRRFIKL